MRVMVIMKASAESEAGQLPSTELLTAMGRFNEELVAAGVMLAGEGLHPSATGKRVRFPKGGAPLVTDGPFAETKELIAGFWLWQVASMEEAVAWARRIPADPTGAGGEAEVELRQVFEAPEFGEALTLELEAQEAWLRERVAAREGK